MKIKFTRTSIDSRIKRMARHASAHFRLLPCPCPPPRRAARLRGSLGTASGGPLGASFRLQGEAGFVLAWWSLFIGLAAFPLLVFVVEGSRYLQASGAVQKAADAAAEAAVREIDVPHYVETGEIRFSGNEYVLAERYANANADYLHVRQIAIVIQSIAVDEAEDTVRVSAWADVSALFPALAPQVNIRREGTAQVRLTAR